MRTFFAVMLAVVLTASLSFADSGTLHPGEDVMIGNLHVANLEGAGGDVTYFTAGANLTLIVNEDAVCAVLKKGTDPQTHRVASLVLGNAYYAQANTSGSYIAVIGDNSIALALALRARHTNNANTIDLMSNGNIAAAVRWCYGKGEVLMNKIRFGVSPSAKGSNNDAYIAGDNQGTRDLLWANRTVDVAGRRNETIAWDGFGCPEPTDEVEPRDVAVDVAEIDKESTAVDAEIAAIK